MLGRSRPALVGETNNIAESLSVACEPCRIPSKWLRSRDRKTSSCTYSARIHCRAQRRFLCCPEMTSLNHSPVTVQCLTYDVRVAATDFSYTCDTCGSIKVPNARTLNRNDNHWRCLAGTLAAPDCLFGWMSLTKLN
jgi:hypothetical protein